MEIKNVKIKNVTVGLDDWEQLVAMMTFCADDGYYDLRFLLADEEDRQRLMFLMQYADVCDVNDLTEKEVRYMENGNSIYGFGHPVEDRFVLISTDEAEEISEDEMKKWMEIN